MSYQDLVASVEVTLKTLCGTSKNGHANACEHDHGPMAAALVRQISHASLTDFAVGFGPEVRAAASVYAVDKETSR